MTKETTNEPEQRFLASVAGNLLPSPDVPVRSRWNLEDRKENVWLTQLLRTLDVLESDISPRAQVRVFGHLANRMAASALKGKDSETIKDRLGQRGILPASSYRVSFGPLFEKLSPVVGVRHAHVETALASPDGVEHFFSDKLAYEGQAFDLSVFLKTHRKKDPFTLLTITSRKGAELRVDTAWRVYHRDVQTNYHDPRGVLAAFVERYGMDFSIGDDATRQKLILDEVRPARNVNRRGGPNLVLHNEGSPGTLCGFYRMTKLNVLVVPILFAINLPSYQRDLRNHGLSLSESFSPFSSFLER